MFVQKCLKPDLPLFDVIFVSSGSVNFVAGTLSSKRVCRSDMGVFALRNPISKRHQYPFYRTLRSISVGAAGATGAANTEEYPLYRGMIRLYS